MTWRSVSLQPPRYPRALDVNTVIPLSSLHTYIYFRYHLNQTNTRILVTSLKDYDFKCLTTLLPSHQLKQNNSQTPPDENDIHRTSRAQDLKLRFDPPPQHTSPNYLNHTHKLRLFRTPADQHIHLIPISIPSKFHRLSRRRHQSLHRPVRNMVCSLTH